MFKKVTLLTAVLLVFSVSLFAQKTKYFSSGISIGTMNYGGDIAPSNDQGEFAPSTLVDETRARVGAHLYYQASPRWGFGAEANYGTIYAYDPHHGIRKRGFEVKSSLLQINSVIEFALIKFDKKFKKVSFHPVVRVGGGVLFYDPQITDWSQFPTDYIVYPHAYITVNGFAGAGVRVRLKRHHMVSMILDLHRTPVDNLDGFTNPSNPNAWNNDAYGSLVFSYSYLFF